MANKEHVRRLLEDGVAVWNKWREKRDSGTSELIRPNLTFAKLGDSKLNGANLRNADLDEADLTGADLTGAKLHGANLTNAILTDTFVMRCSFVNVSLHALKGLDAIRYLGPCTIDVDTLERTAADLSNDPSKQQQQAIERFLEGAGVRKEYIELFRSRIGSAIEFYSCFISYSTKDQEFTERLYSDLRIKNIRCWFAPHNVQAGKKLHEQIDQAIRIYDKLLLILSSNSMNSEWVKTEISKARKRELHEKRQMLFPVRLVPFETLRDWECFDADTGKDSAREIREYYVPDFSTWKTNHDAYKQELEKLVAALQAPDKTASASR